MILYELVGYINNCFVFLVGVSRNIDVNIWFKWSIFCYVFGGKLGEFLFIYMEIFEDGMCFGIMISIIELGIFF